MFCQICGAQVTDGGTLCEKCKATAAPAGQPQFRQPQYQQAPQQFQQPPQPQYQPPYQQPPQQPYGAPGQNPYGAPGQNPYGYGAPVQRPPQPKGKLSLPLFMITALSVFTALAPALPLLWMPSANMADSVLDTLTATRNAGLQSMGVLSLICMILSLLCVSGVLAGAFFLKKLPFNLPYIVLTASNGLSFLSYIFMMIAAGISSTQNTAVLLSPLGILMMILSASLVAASILMFVLKPKFMDKFE